jgi:hypothetical protein
VIHTITVEEFHSATLIAQRSGMLLDLADSPRSVAAGVPTIRHQVLWFGNDPAPRTVVTGIDSGPVQWGASSLLWQGRLAVFGQSEAGAPILAVVNEGAATMKDLSAYAQTHGGLSRQINDGWQAGLVGGDNGYAGALKLAFHAGTVAMLGRWEGDDGTFPVEDVSSGVSAEAKALEALSAAYYGDTSVVTAEPLDNGSAIRLVPASDARLTSLDFPPRTDTDSEPPLATLHGPRIFYPSPDLTVVMGRSNAEPTSSAVVLAVNPATGESLTLSAADSPESGIIATLGEPSTLVMASSNRVVIIPPLISTLTVPPNDETRHRSVGLSFASLIGEPQRIDPQSLARNAPDRPAIPSPWWRSATFLDIVTTFAFCLLLAVLMTWLFSGIKRFLRWLRRGKVDPSAKNSALVATAPPQARAGSPRAPRSRRRNPNVGEPYPAPDPTPTSLRPPTSPRANPYSTPGLTAADHQSGGDHTTGPTLAPPLY